MIATSALMSSRELPVEWKRDGRCQLKERWEVRKRYKKEEDICVCYAEAVTQWSFSHLQSPSQSPLLPPASPSLGTRPYRRLQRPQFQSHSSRYSLRWL